MITEKYAVCTYEQSLKNLTEKHRNVQVLLWVQRGSVFCSLILFIYLCSFVSHYLRPQTSCSLFFRQSLSPPGAASDIGRGGGMKSFFTNIAQSAKKKGKQERKMDS